MDFEINGLVIVSISAKWHVLYDELPLKYSLSSQLAIHRWFCFPRYRCYGNLPIDN